MSVEYVKYLRKLLAETPEELSARRYFYELRIRDEEEALKNEFNPSRR